MELDLYYQKKINCHHCLDTFETYRVRSTKAKFVKRDADYCPYYEDANPVLYEVNVCPTCGFSFTDNFSMARIFKYKDIIEEKYVSKLASKPNLCNERTEEEALYAYKLALYSAQLVEENKLILANIALRIAWINRYLKNEEEEKRYLKNVVELYTEVYETEDLDKIPMDKYLLIYLIGELNGRLGDYQKVKRWFSNIIEDKNAEPKILNLTKSRWQDYREILEKEKN